MNKSQAKYLTAAERSLVEQTVPRVLATFDEDELVALHDRVRRASTKYRTLYRRQSASPSAGNAAVARQQARTRAPRSSRRSSRRPCRA